MRFKPTELFSFYLVPNPIHAGSKEYNIYLFPNPIEGTEANKTNLHALKDTHRQI